MEYKERRPLEMPNGYTSALPKSRATAFNGHFLVGVQKHVDGNDYYYFTGGSMALVGLDAESLVCLDSHTWSRGHDRDDADMILFLLLILLWLSLCLNLYFWDRLKGEELIIEFYKTTAQQFRYEGD